MLVPVLIAAIIVLGSIVGYLYFLAPRLNPFNRAESLLQSQRIDEAIVEYRKVLEKRPLDVNVLSRLSELYLKQNKLDQAVIYLEKIVDINTYGAETEKPDIFKLLSRIYLKRGEKDRAFAKYFELLRDYPSDTEALYHVGFIALGQEVFDVAFKYLEMLSKLEKTFRIFFGAGIAALQNQRSAEAVALFKEALALEPHSDIANIAMSFALNRKRDYKTSTNYARMVVDNTEDDTALFIARRLLAFIYIEVKKASLAVKLLKR